MDMQNPTWLRRWMDGELLTRWKQFFKELSHGHVLTFPRCYFATIKIDTANYHMRLFDASTAAYAAALYLKKDQWFHIVEFCRLQIKHCTT